MFPLAYRHSSPPLKNTKTPAAAAEEEEDDDEEEKEERCQRQIKLS